MHPLLVALWGFGQSLKRAKLRRATAMASSVDVARRVAGIKIESLLWP